MKTCNNDENESANLFGFSLDDIKKEVQRAARLVGYMFLYGLFYIFSSNLYIPIFISINSSFQNCVYCKKKGASIGCWIRNCRKSFHFPCAIENKCTYEFTTDYRSYCNVHFDSNTLNTCAPNNGSELCAICFLEMGQFDATKNIKLVCCDDQMWYHKICLKKMAFKLTDDFGCPSCENETYFRENMVSNGIFIPPRGYMPETDEIESEEPKPKRNRVHKVWVLERSFNSKAEAMEYLNAENCWSYFYKNKSEAGVRINYRCELMKFRGQQCAAGIYLLYDSTNTRVHLYRVTVQHTHNDADNRDNLVSNISGEIEREIREMFEQRLKPKTILYFLRRFLCRYK